MPDGNSEPDGPQGVGRNRGLLREIARDSALEGARAIGGMALHMLGIAILILLGAAGIGAGLWYGMGWLAIAGGVLIAGALLWAMVLWTPLW